MKIPVCCLAALFLSSGTLPAQRLCHADRRLQISRGGGAARGRHHHPPGAASRLQPAGRAALSGLLATGGGQRKQRLEKP